MPASLQARITRTAISPRLAIRTFWSGLTSGHVVVSSLAGVMLSGFLVLLAESGRTGRGPARPLRGWWVQGGEVLAAAASTSSSSSRSRRCRGAARAPRGVRRSGRAGTAAGRPRRAARRTCSRSCGSPAARSRAACRAGSAEPDPVAGVEDAGGAAALGGDQPDVLVVPERAQGDAELLGQRGDRPGRPSSIGSIGLALPLRKRPRLLTFT